MQDSSTNTRTPPNHQQSFATAPRHEVTPVKNASCSFRCPDRVLACRIQFCLARAYLKQGIECLESEPDLHQRLGQMDGPLKRWRFAIQEQVKIPHSLYKKRLDSCHSPAWLSFQFPFTLFLRIFFFYLFLRGPACKCQSALLHSSRTRW